MKFNEKLMELRKKEGLSQEDLGEKLNVTRQTISKWELGQTTPEIENLLEISKTFNISVDELLKGEECIENEIKEEKNDLGIEETIVENKEKKKDIKIILITILVIILILIIGKYI